MLLRVRQGSLARGRRWLLQLSNAIVKTKSPSASGLDQEPRGIFCTQSEVRKLSARSALGDGD